MPTYDVIVIGTGAVGSATLDQLAGRGLSVLGLDRFPPGHDRGSSHGQSRIIRQAYFEHVDYVPLLLEAYRLWHDLQARSGQRLFHQVGLVEIGPPDGEVVAGVLRAARQHQLAVEELSAREVAGRFPAFRVPEGMVGVFEPTAGYLLVEDAVRAQAAQAVARGAELRVGETVLGWNATERGVVVRTDRAEYHAGGLVVAAGAWAGALLAELQIPLCVLRKSVFWFPPSGAGSTAGAEFPTFLYDLPQGCFYGFPPIGGRGIKVAEHSGGTVVDNPLEVDRTLHADELARVAEFCRDHLPAVGGSTIEHAVCLYTMSPDGHFIVDRHPAWPQVALAAGLSGHGFKFAPVLGRVLADLVIDGRTDLPIEFLSCGRPGLAS